MTDYVYIPKPDGRQRPLQFDERRPADNMDLVRSHAASRVASNPDIIVASGGRIVPVLMRLHDVNRLEPGILLDGDMHRDD